MSSFQLESVLVFILAIFLVEPYKRRKLAKTFETRLLEGEAHSAKLIQGTVRSLENEIHSLKIGLGLANQESDSSGLPMSLSSQVERHAMQEQHFQEDYVGSDRNAEGSNETLLEDAKSGLDQYKAGTEAAIEAVDPDLGERMDLIESPVSSSGSSSNTNENTFDLDLEQDEPPLLASDPSLSLESSISTSDASQTKQEAELESTAKGIESPYSSIASSLESWKGSSRQFLSRLNHSLRGLVYPTAPGRTTGEAKGQDLSTGESHQDANKQFPSINHNDLKALSGITSSEDTLDSEATRTTISLKEEYKGSEERERDVILAGGVGMVVGAGLVTLFKLIRN